MPWNGRLSSLWNHIELYKQPARRWSRAYGVCFVCRGFGVEAAGICLDCLGDLPTRLNPQLSRNIPSIDAAFAAFRYEFPIIDVIKSAKFHADLGALAMLGAGFTPDFLGRLDDIDVLIPVPLLPSRFLARGYNQASELARTLARLTGYTVRHDLVARQQTWGKAQSRLGAAARHENMKGAFRVKRDLAGLRLAIVDDIITTGATCSALAQALRQAGAIKITAIAAAATSLRHDQPLD